MKFYRPVAIILFVSSFSSIGCSGTSTPSSSSTAGALTANSAITNPIPRPFERHTLNSGNYLNQFIRPEVRAKLDEEPTGDSDASYDPSTVDTSSSSEQPTAESPTEPENEEPAQAGEDSHVDGARLDTLKFAWARAAFGDAVKANPTNTGVIVVYADENYYEVDRLMAYVEEGRDKVASASKMGGDKIKVVFGGYRSAPQVEMWVIPQGGSMPEFKPEERPKAE